MGYQSSGIFIGGQWRASQTGSGFTVYNPANGNAFSHVSDATRDDAKAAIEAAALAQPAWAALPFTARAQYMLKIAEILVEAGLPCGLFNVIQGSGVIGSALVSDPRIDKVSLTGSVATGKKVYAAAASEMKHVTMELGGKSPLIIFDDANIDNSVSGAILANFYSSGQLCSNGTRVFVQRNILENFLSQLTARLSLVIIGDPQDESTTFGPMVSKQQLDIVLGYFEKGKKEGARLISGGKAIAGNGFFVEPTVFADVTDDMAIAKEEVFGPLMSVLTFDKEEEVISRANATTFGLAAGVFTKDISRAHRVVDALDAGTCFINSYNDAPVEVPFGGMKMSGVGRENSKAAISHYTQLKSAFVRMNDVESPF